MDDGIIRRALAAADLNPDLVLGKTRELFRLLQMKMPLGCLKKAEACRHIIAIELSCRVLRIPFDKSKLMSQAPVNQSIYQEALISCKNVLNMKWDAGSAIDVLSVQYGVQIQGQANSNLETYRKAYIDKLDKSRQAHIDLNSPPYQAAAFILAAKMKKARIDKVGKIAQVLEVDAAFLRTVVDSMTRVILGEDAQKPKSIAAKRRAEDTDTDGAAENQESTKARRLSKEKEDDCINSTNEEFLACEGSVASKPGQVQLQTASTVAFVAPLRTNNALQGKGGAPPPSIATRVALKPEELRQKRLQALSLSCSSSSSADDVNAMKENAHANANAGNGSGSGNVKPTVLDRLKPTATPAPSCISSVSATSGDDALGNNSVTLSALADTSAESDKEKKLNSRELYELWKQKARAKKEQQQAAQVAVPTD